MFLKRLSLQNFRNIKELTLDIDSNCIIIWGRNGQGKTNILEAIGMLSDGKSFRTRSIGQLIRNGHDRSIIDAKVVRGSDMENIRIVLDREQGKTIYINGIKIVDPYRFFGRISFVILSPSDISLVDGSPAMRRNFLDRGIFTKSPIYLTLYLDYYKIVKHRNRLLKDTEDLNTIRDQLETWDAQMVDKGIQLIKQRREFIKVLASVSPRILGEITEDAERLELIYKSNLGNVLPEDDEKLSRLFNAQLASNIEKEFKQGSTSTGPHRDNMAILLDGLPLREYGSLGQKRSAVIALHLARMADYYDCKGSYPILLLDDIELDLKRSQSYLDFILGSYKDTQIFLTTTDRSKFTPSNLAYQGFEIENGRIQGE